MPAELPLSLGPVLLIGAGWLGEPLALQLQKQSIQVVVTARKEERISALQNTGLSAWRLDMEDSGETMGLSTRLNSFQTIIWAVPPGKTANVSYAAQLQRLLLHWPAESGRKLIFFSSTGVYPDVAAVWDENSPVQEQHRVTAAERVVKDWGGDCLVLRCGGLCDERRIIGRYFSEKIVSAAEQPVNYIHREDVIGATIHLLKLAKTGIYNLVAPQHPSKKSVFHSQAQQHNFAHPLAYESGGIQRIISAEKLIQTGYKFIRPDPTTF